MMSNSECPKCGYNKEGIHVIPVSVDTEYFDEHLDGQGGHLGRYKCPKCGYSWTDRHW